MQSGEWRVKQCTVLRFSAFTLWCQFVGKLCTFMSSHGVGVLSLCWLSCQKLPLLQHNYRTASPSCFTTSFFYQSASLDYFYSSKENQKVKERRADAHAKRCRQSAREPQPVLELLELRAEARDDDCVPAMLLLLLLLLSQ